MENMDFLYLSGNPFVELDLGGIDVFKEFGSPRFFVEENLGSRASVFLSPFLLLSISILRFGEEELGASVRVYTRITDIRN
ncbi:hypothetical protein H6P81_019994 [Aristolochia fimbriata]|uniref:Uncharacterized protein n=1 Tax=Aristolochia fimbriata TaxID=158543 RepID=A0AAV7DU72_ARIFI|nr:hypothetical protein H6P81_019994 [Aristolochia fimbriata]